MTHFRRSSPDRHGRYRFQAFAPPPFFRFPTLAPGMQFICMHFPRKSHSFFIFCAQPFLFSFHDTCKAFVFCNRFSRVCVSLSVFLSVSLSLSLSLCIIYIDTLTKRARERDRETETETETERKRHTHTHTHTHTTHSHTHTHTHTHTHYQECACLLSRAGSVCVCVCVFVCVCVCVCVCVVLTDAFTRFIIFNTTTTDFFCSGDMYRKARVNRLGSHYQRTAPGVFAAVFLGGSVVSFPITGPSRLRSDSVFLLQ